ncbi:MAG: Xaa-Pro peptidase family protein [Mariprofundaceae bacterium]
MPDAHADARLIIADSEHDADMLYVAGIFVPDPFVAVELDGEWHGLFSPLEVDRARAESRFAHVHEDSEWRRHAACSDLPAGLAGVAAAFLRAHGARRIAVPDGFPLGHAESLRRAGFELRPAGGAFFPQRATKREPEIRQLARAERLTRRAMRAAERWIAACGVGPDGVLRSPDDGRRVKSAHLRRVIETFLIGQGAMPAHTIVACGREGADPHNVGHGLLRAGQPIIIDIFPRLTDTGYWGDMTRTFVKGRASAEVRAMHRAVREAQDIGLEMAMAGVNGADIHRRIQSHFERSGFPTRVVRGRQTGFFHGTGHGVGLEIHEEPRISTCDAILKPGHVVTIEPGLYYPNLGGVRIEDLIVIREQGHENLTRFHRRLEIP